MTTKEKIVAEYPTQYFNVRVFKGGEVLPDSLPAVTTQASPIRDHGAFVSKRVKDSNRKYDRTLLDLTNAAKDMADRVNLYMPVVEPLLTDYDIEEIIPSTCALGMWNSASTDFESLGQLGLDTDVTYPTDIVRDVITWYKNYLKPPGEKTNTMVRGKTIGWPYMIGGMNRAVNDIFMAMSAAVVNGHAIANPFTNSLQSLVQNLGRYHGDPFSMEGNRFQNSAKPRYAIVKEGVYKTYNLNPRSRIIAVDPKVFSMIIRTETKTMLSCILNAPQHSQDRSDIKRRIESATKKGWKIWAADQSKFDFRHGGDRGRQQIDIHAQILQSKFYQEAATYAFNTRLFTFGYKKMWQVPGDSLLKSGMGTTTLIGCTGSWTALIAAMSKSLNKPGYQILNEYGRTWDALSWGDDLVLMHEDPSWKEKIIDGWNYYRLDVTEEPTVKYLGNNYAKGDFKGTMDKGYSMGRAFQQQFFPERKKEYPFSTIGYIARLDLMGPKAQDFHDRMLPHFAELSLGKPFRFDQRHLRLEQLIPEMQKYSNKIGQIDDVLQVFTHGLQGLDIENEIDIPDQYFELLGMSQSVDIDDPLSWLDTQKIDNPKVFENVTPSLMRYMADVASGNFNNYNRMLYEMVYAFRLTYNRGSVIY